MVGVRFFTVAILVVYSLGATGAASDAKTNETTRIQAARASVPPKLDASLSDPAWKNAVTASGLQSITTQRPSTLPATFMLLYDDANVYVGVRAAQPGVALTASQGANDVGFGLDDFVGVGLDTSTNASQVYFFMTTPLGTRYQQSSESARYYPPWTTVTKTTADGWNAMLVIPIKNLRTAGGASRTWRFNFIRRVAAINQNESWAYDPLMNDGGNGVSNFPASGDARFWPYLVDLRLGVKTISRQNPHAEVYGLATAGEDRRRFSTASRRFDETGPRNAGADVVVPVTGSAAFVGTFGPDFSNVETDQQTIAPHQFRLALAEYRPFFAQGAEFFDPLRLNALNGPPNRIFYSPAYGPFYRGLKLEGNAGHQSFGAMEIQGAGFDDLVFGLKHRLADRSFDWSFDGVLANHQAGNETVDPRAVRDVTWQAQIDGRNNRSGFVYGLDYAHEHSTLARDDRLAYKSEDFLDVHRGNYEVFAGYRDVGPQFAPVTGYVQNADVRGPQAYVDLNGTLAPHGPVKRAELFVEADRFLDRTGTVHQADVNINLDLQLRNGLHFNGGPFVEELRTYGPYQSLVGWPTYAGGVTRSYNGHAVRLGYRDGSAAPVDATYSWGPFGDFFLQQYTLAAQRAIGTRWNITAELDGTRERRLKAASDGQTLRRITVAESINSSTTFSLSLREINGIGGFASPGVNLAGSFHHRFRNDNELFLNYGTPAAVSTLQRFLIKYVIRVGGGAGT